MNQRLSHFLTHQRTVINAALLATAVATFGVVGCSLPGKPAPGPEVPVPSAELDFNKLYGQNCSGCHGDNGQHGAAIALNNPEYLALVDDASLRNVTANGYKNGLMPGFGKQAGGMLTDEQINVIVQGMRSHWGKGTASPGTPAYASSKQGDVARGAQVYTTACASCHGAAGTGAQKGSILNGSYLALMNQQSLRTITIVGRPEYGMPGWRGANGSHPLSDDDVTNVVAWLQAQTPAYAGQPYALKTPSTSDSSPAAQAPNQPSMPTHSKGGKS